MRASESQQTGGAGIHEVMAKFERIGWAPHQTEALHDLGTDLLVVARDDRRFERGLVIGVQVKSGPSWFTRPKRDLDGKVVGWWHYESETDHFDYWTTSPWPHLLVLHDLAESISYWVHVTADKIERVGHGCKILVPTRQVIDADSEGNLLKVALWRRAGESFEGTAFGAGARNIPPGRRLRFALIAPRLVAPHRNRGYSETLAPEEAVALLARGRFLDLQRFSESHASVPDPSDPEGSTDWRWQLVHAFWCWGTENYVTPIEEALARSPDDASRAAATALLACALRREERFEEAQAQLDNIISSDLLAPVDHAWMLIQRSRLLAITGNADRARDDAARAQRALAATTEDVTASALAAAASWQLFDAAGVMHGDLASALNANDTVVSWWREQTLSWGLKDASLRMFRDWSEDKTHRWSFEDSAAVNLFAAELNADLTGEHDAWKSIAALSARHRLMTTSPSDTTSVADALDDLRKSGISESLKLAVDHLRTSGPLSAVAQAVNRITDTRWTRTTALTNFQFWNAAGDLVDPAAATHYALWCIDVLRDTSLLTTELSLTFLVELEAAGVLASLLSAAGPEAHQAAAEILSERGEVDDFLKGPFARVASLLQPDVLSTEMVARLWDFASATKDQVAVDLLGSLASSGHAEARQELLRRSTGRDLDALAALGKITILDDEAAEGLVADFEAQVREVIHAAETGSYGFGGSDPAHGLAIFSHWFPKVARWDVLVEFLANPAVAGEHKHQACQSIVALGSRLSDEARAAIGSSVGGLSATKNQEFLPGKKAGGLAEAVGIAVGVTSGPAADEAVATLVLGTRAERRQVAYLLGYGHCGSMRPLLASLSVDAHSEVRLAAIEAIGRLSRTDPDKVLMTLCKRIVVDASLGAPRALLSGTLSDDTPLSDGLRETIGVLIDHPSAIVRSAARRVLAS